MTSGCSAKRENFDSPATKREWILFYSGRRFFPPYQPGGRGPRKNRPARKKKETYGPPRPDEGESAYRGESHRQEELGSSKAVSKDLL